MKPEVFYEIELKALLTKKQHAHLVEELPKKFTQINEETMTTTRYRREGTGPEDIRLRHSDKTIEIVSKTGDPTHLARKEVRIPLDSKAALDHFVHVFEGIGLSPNPPWVKHKTEYTTTHNGHEYVLCLQHIFDFAYILEVETLSEQDDSAIHGPNIKEIIENLGLEPIDPAKFSERINEYIKNEKVAYQDG